mgnify:CR=1 FL=1|jgi:hypothetical protein
MNQRILVASLLALLVAGCTTRDGHITECEWETERAMVSYSQLDREATKQNLIGMCMKAKGFVRDSKGQWVYHLFAY